MTANQFFVPAIAEGAERIVVAGAEHRHLARSARVRPGESVWLIDAAGRRALARVERVGEEATELAVLERQESEGPRFSRPAPSARRSEEARDYHREGRRARLRRGSAGHDDALAAALALGELRNPAAIDALVMALTDEEPSVRQAAAAALERIDPSWMKSEVVHKASLGLKPLLNDPRPWVSAAAAQVLARLKTARQQAGG